MDIDLWPLVDALMTWVIIPIAAMLWVHNQKLANHDRDVLRIVTLLAERKDQRDEDHAELNAALHDLRGAIQHLDQRLADFALAQSAQAGASIRGSARSGWRSRG